MKLLFDTEGKSDKRQIGKRLEIVLRENEVAVYRNYEYIETKQIKSSFEKRLAIVQLVNNYNAMKNRLAEVFDISRQSIDNWLNSFATHGALGLINNTKDSWKKNPHRFKGNKSRELEQNRLEAKQYEQQKEAKRKAEQELELFDNLEPAPEPIKTDSYTDNYNFEDNRYAGSMILIGMIEHLYHFHDASAKVYDGQIAFLYLFIQMHILEIGSIEQLKVIQKHEFGRVTGMSKLPSLPNVWKEVHQGANAAKVDGFMTDIFKYQAINGLVGLEGLALDGHFRPYYGNKKIRSGYFTQRDMMMPGETQMFLHDDSGRVVYFETQEGKGDIVKTLKKASEYVEGLNNGQKPLIAIDREVWGVKNFIYLSGLRVVTWQKHIDATKLEEIDIKMFKAELTKNGKTWKLYEDTKDFTDKDKNKVNLRRIILHNTANKKRLSMVTTDREEDNLVIANTMLNRWGSNENTFKYTKERTQMHYNPTIRILNESSNQEVANPVYIDKNKELQKEKKTLAKTQRTIGKIPITQNKDEKLRKNQHRDDLNAKAITLKQKIEMLKNELGDIPERIDLGSIGEKKYKQIDHEGINLWSLCGSIFWNSRKELIQRFAQYLPDFRDTIPVLEALIKAPGRIKSSPNSLLMTLETQETPRYKSAQIQLLRYVNSLNIKLNGKLLRFNWKVSNST